MAENLLSVKTLEALRPESLQQGKTLTLKDGGSLYGRVKLRDAAPNTKQTFEVASAKGGTKAVEIVVRFEYHYRTPKGTRCKVCGVWPDDTLATIRKARDGLRVEVRGGADPVEQKKTAKLAKAVEIASEQQRHHDELARIAAENAARVTVSELFTEWSNTKHKDHKDGGERVRNIFAWHILPKLGSVALHDLTREMLKRRLTEIAQTAPVMANRVYAQLNTMFDYARRHEKIERNYLEDIERSDYGGAVEEPSDRELTGEIKELIETLPKSGLLADKQAAVWILLATGARVGELSKAKWSNVNLESKTWLIPKEDSKNGLAHTIYLSEFTIKQFQTLKPDAGFTYVFPAILKAKDENGQTIKRADGTDKTIETHMDDKTLTKMIRDRQRPTPIKGRTPNNTALVLSGGEWTPHDLRRTCATIMGDKGVAGDIIEKALNHKPTNKMVRIYHRSTRSEELKAAWQLVGEFLERQVSGGANVVELKRA